MKTSDLVVKLLEEAGVECIFGVPGGAIEELNTALCRSGITSFVTRHEAGAAFMADGYARVSGKLGVCCSTAGPGATNLITGLASSYADSIPVCALTGQVATSVFGKGAIQESGAEGVNLVSIFRNFTKYSGMLLNVKRVQYMVEKGIRLAISGRMGPVHLSLPVDVMKMPAEKVTSPNCGVASKMFERQGVLDAAKALLSAKRPAIIAGWGTVLSGGAEPLFVLANLLKIPVATSPKAKGVFPESDPLSLGCLGFAGSPVAKEYIVERDVDVLLAVGTSFNEMMTGGWDERLRPSGTLIQIDADSEEIGKNYPATYGLVGDALTILEEIVYSILREVGGEVSAWQELADTVRRGARENNQCLGKLCRQVKERGQAQLTEVGELKEKHREVPLAWEGALYHPRQLVADIQHVMPADTLYFADIGTSMAWAIRYMVIDRPRSFFVSLGFGSMGYAVAAPVGAKQAAKERPVVALVGDGSFMMNGMEVATAVEYNLPVIWVVFNNSMYGMVYHGRKLFSPPVPEGIRSDFKRADIAKVAEGLGARGIRIDRPGMLTAELLAEVVASGKPTVLDVWIDDQVVPPIHSRIETVAKHYK